MFILAAIYLDSGQVPHFVITISISPIRFAEFIDSMGTCSKHKFNPFATICRTNPASKLRIDSKWRSLWWSHYEGVHVKININKRHPFFTIEAESFKHGKTLSSFYKMHRDPKLKVLYICQKRQPLRICMAAVHLLKFPVGLQFIMIYISEAKA